MASSGVSVNRNGVIIIAVLVVGAIIFYHLHWRSPAVETFTAEVLFEKKEVDISKLPEMPVVTDEELSAYTAERVTIPVEVKTLKLNIYSLQMKPKSEPKGTVLLLHGLGDTSHTWVQFNTMHLMAHWGYRVVAVDLPGFGNSKESVLDVTPHEDFMLALVKTLGPGLPVIVAPSMAGSFALPYLFKSPGVSVERAAALVAVAVTTSEPFVNNYPQNQLRTLILYGDQDIRLGVYSRERLQALPRSHIITLPNAGHGPLKEQTVLFHRALYHYLRYLEKK